MTTFFSQTLFTSLVTIILLAVFIIYHWQRRKLYALSRKLNGPIALPIVGNIHQFGLVRGKSSDVFKTIHTLYGSHRKTGTDIGRVWVGPYLFIALGDVKTITTVLNHNLKKATIYQVFDEVLHQGIFINKNIPQWRSSRKTIVPVFHFNILKSYIRIFHSEASILVSKWEKYADSDASFNPENEINLATFDMVMMSTLGISPQAQENSSHEFLYHIDKAFEIAMTRMFNPLLHSNLVCSLIGLRARQKAHVKVLKDVAQNTLNQIRERLKRNSDKGVVENNATEYIPNLNIESSFKSFAELMMESADYNKSDDELLISQIITIIGAGQDTTKSQNMVTLILLAIHQDVQDKVLEELDHVLGSDSSYCPTYEDLCKLEYLDMVIKESLRLYPAAPIIGRHIDEDFDLGNGIILPEGVTVFISIYAVHRDPKYYDNPNQFDPNRWTPDLVAQRPPNCFMPFSTGPRNCIGGKYAMMQMKTVLSTILRKYRILPAKECSRMEDIAFDWKITIKLNENCKIRLEKRR
uniref:Cytochrome P450 4g15 n=1 Tax=Cacopsylla melanoneura TaxID=428564 RepID=A0A8D9AC24_9HEMI